MRKNIAIVLAGGIGSRLGLSTPKQFFKVAGKMVVEHTIDAFESNPHIDEIAIVSNPFYIADFESIIIKNGWKKVKKILKGRSGKISFQPFGYQSLRRQRCQPDFP